jgi:hypothetical protein
MLFSFLFHDSVPYFKNRFGHKHFVVGYIYNYMWVWYWEIDRPAEAVKWFAVAKDILDAYLGPNHADSIEVSQNLSKAYRALGRYECFSWSLGRFPA